MTDNRALWELVEMWRERYAKELKKTIRHPFDAVEYKICADELAAILERPVVVGDDEDGQPIGYADWYNRRFLGRICDTERDSYCEEAWRAALESMVSGRQSHDHRTR